MVTFLGYLSCLSNCIRFIVDFSSYSVYLLFLFQLSLCDAPLTELSNPGAGGSIFYISLDDEFIIKTAQHKEANFLQKLLPGYYMVCCWFN